MKTAYYLIATLALATAGAAIGAEQAAPATTSTEATATTARQQAPKQQGLTRAEVRAQVIEARKNGTLIESEADMDVAQTRKHYAL